MWWFSRSSMIWRKMCHFKSFESEGETMQRTKLVFKSEIWHPCHPFWYYTMLGSSMPFIRVVAYRWLNGLRTSEVKRWTVTWTLPKHCFVDPYANLVVFDSTCKRQLIRRQWSTKYRVVELMALRMQYYIQRTWQITRFSTCRLKLLNIISQKFANHCQHTNRLSHSLIGI